MGTTKLNIGKIPISKGEYQEGTAYQRLNQVTMLGSTYQSKIDDNTSAPAQMGADGAVENINTDKWLCIAVGNVSAARKVVYNNETSGLEAGNVQEAIDEVGSKVSDLSRNMRSEYSLKQGTNLIDLQTSKIFYGFVEEATVMFNGSSYDWATDDWRSIVIPVTKGITLFMFIETRSTSNVAPLAFFTSLSQKGKIIDFEQGNDFEYTPNENGYIVISRFKISCRITLKESAKYTFGSTIELYKELAGKVNKSDLLQEVGNATDNAMSQKAVSDVFGKLKVDLNYSTKPLDYMIVPNVNLIDNAICLKFYGYVNKTHAIITSGINFGDIGESYALPIVKNAELLITYTYEKTENIVPLSLFDTKFGFVKEIEVSEGEFSFTSDIDGYLLFCGFRTDPIVKYKNIVPVSSVGFIQNQKKLIENAEELGRLKSNFDGFKEKETARNSYIDAVEDNYYSKLGVSVLTVKNRQLQADGTIMDKSGWNVSEYIPCRGKSVLVFNTFWGDMNTPHAAFYDKDKKFISSVIVGADVGIYITKVPSNTCYVVLCGHATFNSGYFCLYKFNSETESLINKGLFLTPNILNSINIDSNGGNKSIEGFYLPQGYKAIINTFDSFGCPLNIVGIKEYSSVNKENVLNTTKVTLYEQIILEAKDSARIFSVDLNSSENSIYYLKNAELRIYPIDAETPPLHNYMDGFGMLSVPMIKDFSFIKSLYKSAICIGDSITVSGNAAGSDPIKTTYPQHLAEYTGWSVENAGLSSRPTVDWWLEKGQTTDFSNYEIAIMMFGTNDSVYDSCCGNFSNPTDYTWTNYKKESINISSEQALKLLVSKIKTDNPECKIFFITQGTKNKKYENMIYEASNFYNIPLLILDKIYSNVPRLRNLYPNHSNNDFVHFTNVGYSALANRIAMEVFQELYYHYAPDYTKLS